MRRTHDGVTKQKEFIVSTTGYHVSVRHLLRTPQLPTRCDREAFLHRQDVKSDLRSLQREHVTLAAQRGGKTLSPKDWESCARFVCSECYGAPAASRDEVSTVGKQEAEQRSLNHSGPSASRAGSWLKRRYAHTVIKDVLSVATSK